MNIPEIRYVVPLTEDSTFMEDLRYAQGWNDCRAAMLAQEQTMKPEKLCELCDEPIEDNVERSELERLRADARRYKRALEEIQFIDEGELISPESAIAARALFDAAQQEGSRDG